MAMGKSVCPASVGEYDPCKGRPYNRYNIYYILERERFLQSIPGYKSEWSRDRGKSDPRRRNIITGYEELRDLPPLIPRYQKLELPHDWYMPGKRKVLKRDHKKSHGVATFQEIAKVVADGWKNIDDETLAYCTEVARVLKQRHRQLKRMGGLKCFAEHHLGRRLFAVPTPTASPAVASNPKLAAEAPPVPRMVDFVLSAPPMPKAVLYPLPTAAAHMPKTRDFVRSAPPVSLCAAPKMADFVRSEPPFASSPGSLGARPRMADFVGSNPPFASSPGSLGARPRMADSVGSNPPFASPPGPFGARQQALVANDCLSSGIVQENYPGGVARREGAPAPQRRCSNASLSSNAASVRSEVDMDDGDIIAMWKAAR